MLFLILASILQLIALSSQHGRMVEPPARNTMWRVGYPTPPNFEDSELFCGGIANQWGQNKGKCGVCGDSYSLKQPRPYETGGNLFRNITKGATRIYHPNTPVDILIQIVANHLGFFEFSLCPKKTFEELETEECFVPVKILSANGTTKYKLTTHRKGLFNFQIQLPANVTCDYCVLRWNWKSANNWGACGDGREAIGCGPQETYRNCAYIVVRHELGIRGPFINHKVAKSGAIIENGDDDDNIPEGFEDRGFTDNRKYKDDRGFTFVKVPTSGHKH